VKLVTADVEETLGPAAVDGFIGATLLMVSSVRSVSSLEMALSSWTRVSMTYVGRQTHYIMCKRQWLLSRQAED
jgi:hypothetical protein